MTHRLRITPHRLGASVGIVLLGLGAIATASALMAPSETALLQASVSARDFGTARLPSRDAGTDAPGRFALGLRALIGAGRTDAALAEIERRRTARPDDLSLRRQRAMLLGTLGRTADQQTELAAIARRTARADDIRALIAAAAARGDWRAERGVFLSLAGQASDAETERLAALDAKAGDQTSAWHRLATLEASGRRISPPAVAQLIALAATHAPADAFLPLYARLRTAGHSVPPLDALLDTIAATRPAVALALATQAAAGDPLRLAERRIRLLEAAGQRAPALALFDRIIAAPAGTVSQAAIVRLAYDLDAVPTLFRAIAAGRLARLPPPLALDLARRAVAAGQPGTIPAIDAAAVGDWRRLDPWLAVQLARRAGDRAGVRRYAAMLPPDRTAGIEEAMARAAGDRTALRDILMGNGKDPATAAERLIADGFAADGERLLLRAAATAAPGDPIVARLLYLWGPRPRPERLAWLLARAHAAPDTGGRLEWLRLYANRAPPGAALAALAGDPAGGTTPSLLARLAIAAGAGRRADAAAAVNGLLDGRLLATAELRRIVPLLPAGESRQRLAVYARLAGAGGATPRMRCDLAWSSFATRRLDEARDHAAACLAGNPDDSAALSLAGEIAQAAGDDTAARRLYARALAATPETAKTVAARATLIERLGRPRDALAIVRAARADALRDGDALQDKALRALEARLLIATGRPAAAGTLLAGTGR
ncbi:hypothetical protein [Sphingomonas solaris]|uniref:Uncharacterized protein n=1 Tax=Alterirhizorhabdus solaris TaxID=2529389 RepID=A0A558QWD3_9SPHN|nr:hypothetical protein [Sphingomonas solaris]TVV71382.1 hypothetical protein FOY91_16955 [Sphingomonas solaris]